MLRFLHIKNIKPCGWISIPNDTSRTPEKTETHEEYVVDWLDIKSCENPKNNPIKSLAYDIECGSSHGDFPQAIKGYTKVSKQLLELPLTNINPEYIKSILQNIHCETFGNISRIYLKDSKPFDDDVIEYLSNEITR
jgi:hypothetical protein